LHAELFNGTSVSVSVSVRCLWNYMLFIYLHVIYLYSLFVFAVFIR